MSRLMGKTFVTVAVGAALVLGACGDDDSSDGDADGGQATQEQVCQQYQDLGAEPSESELDELVATAQSTDDADLISEVTAAVAELEAGDDGGPAAEALASTCI